MSVKLSLSTGMSWRDFLLLLPRLPFGREQPMLTFRNMPLVRNTPLVRKSLPYNFQAMPSTPRMTNAGRKSRWLATVFCVACIPLGCDRTSSVSSQRKAEPVIEVAPEAGPASTRLSVTKSIPQPSRPPAATELDIRFTDIHESLGVNFVYANGARGKVLMTESIGGGAGWTDFDRDGNWDLLLPQGGFADGPRGENPPNQLYQNLGKDGFSQVQTQASVDDRGYGQGVAIADFDNDGFDDIYVTNVGSNILYHNQGDGTFTEVTATAGVDSPLWSCSAAWGDLDADGNLDLFVCNYLVYDPMNPLNCPHEDGTPSICDPMDLDAEKNVCFQSMGDGTFREVSREFKVVGNESDSKSLGVAILDLTGDGYSDIFVANDTTSNFLFVNDGHGRFRERGVELGCAISGEGIYQASMGIAVGDYDGNQRFDIYLTHFTDDSNTIYANLGAAGFHDTTRSVGLHQPTLQMLGFGTVMADFDGNGSLELFVTNGHVEDYKREVTPYEMPPQLFTYSGTKWEEISSRAGGFFDTRHVGRAVASCDFDNDGDLDLAVVHQNSPAALLRNDSAKNNWLKIHLIGVRSNRSAIGTTVRLRCGTIDQVQQIVGGSSYCASHEPVLIFGLGKATEACDLEIRWPDGFVQKIDGVTANQAVTFREAAHEFDAS